VKKKKKRKEQAEEWDATCSYTHGIAYSGAATPSVKPIVGKHYGVVNPLDN
jgi:hypothetical protein